MTQTHAFIHSIDNSDALFWYGYLITRWCIQEQIYGKDISDNYNIISILQSYDVLHSLSIDNAIDHIKLDNRLENIERSELDYEYSIFINE